VPAGMRGGHGFGKLLDGDSGVGGHGITCERQDAAQRRPESNGCCNGLMLLCSLRDPS
jgi:hypothetical protein